MRIKVGKKWRLFLVAILFLFLGTSLYAQQPRKNFVYRTMDWGYRIIEGDSAHPRKNLILPIPILAYKPETRWIFGVSMNHIFKVSKDSLTRPSNLMFNVSYSQERQFSVRPIVDFFSKNNKFNIRGEFNYTNFGENYYGIGPNTPASNEEFYSFQMQFAILKVAYQFFPNFYGGIQYNGEKMYNINAVEGGLLKTGGELGNNGYSASGAGLTLYYDNRDHVFFPHNGQIIEVSNVFYGSFLGSQYQFVNVKVDARKYIHLWKENVLAVQGYANLNDGDIPFRMQGVLGSDMFMRGYYNGRFRDKHAMAFQAELRKTVWGPISIVLFAGGGSVASNKWDLANGIKPNYGLGLRVKAIPSERINIRLDYGLGSQNNRALYISLFEAF